MIALIEDGNEASEEVEVILGMRVLRLKIVLPQKLSGAKLDKLLGKTAVTLKQNRVRKLCCKTNFAYKNWFENCGFSMCDGRYLYEQIVAEAAVKYGGNCAAFVAKSLGVNEERVLMRLCENFRYVLVRIEYGGENVCRSIQNRLGVAAVELHWPQQLESADAVVCFAPVPWRARLKEKCLVAAADLRETHMLIGGRRLVSFVPSIAGNKVRDVPLGYDASALLSAAMLCGAVDCRNVKIEKMRTA